MKQEIIYRCDYCGKKKYISKYQMAKHEKQCFSNPENKTCGSCLYNDFGFCGKGLKEKGELPVVKCNKWMYKEI